MYQPVLCRQTGTAFELACQHYFLAAEICNDNANTRVNAVSNGVKQGIARLTPAEPVPINRADQTPYIRFALPLDEPRHLCIDLPGHGTNANPVTPFSVHTCKDDMWNYDERFR